MVPGTAVAMLHLAVAAPPDKQTALKHDDDLGVANLDSAEIAFRIPPAFRQQPLPALTFASPEPRPGWVFRRPVATQTTHGVEANVPSATGQKLCNSL